MGVREWIASKIVGVVGLDAIRALERRLSESYQDMVDSYVDPADAYRDDDGGEDWIGIGDGLNQNRLVLTEQQLTLARKQCYLLAATNEFAINGHENRISYIVGTGHKYSATAKEGFEVPEETLSMAQRVLDEFVRMNRWQQRQQEIVRRRDRDGECFLRFFRDGQGRLLVRFVEPEDVKTPERDRTATYGIQTAPGDVESVEAYWIDGEQVDASEVQHRKSNVDGNVKRGVPLFWPVRKNLRRAEKLLRNMSVVAGIQSSIAIIRKHAGGTKSGVEKLRSDNADYSVTSQATGKTSYHRKYGPGTILDASQSIDYEFPANAVNAAAFVGVLQAELRAIASRLVMPEFMLTSDASNANYASTMVAEGPAVKMFDRMQAEMIEEDKAVMRLVIEEAERYGIIPRGTGGAIEIQVTPPKLATVNRMEDAQADSILVTSGAMSPQTMAERHGLDPEREQERISELRAAVDPYGAGDWQVAGGEPVTQPAVTDPTQPTATQGAAAAAGDVQAAALNGAQIDSLVSIINQVSIGELNREAAILLIQASFPLIQTATIEKLVGSVQTREVPPDAAGGQSSQ